MGVRINSAFSNTFVGPLPANNTETTICVSPVIILPLDNTAVIIFASFALIFGTGTTQCIYAIRRGTTTAGPLVNGFSYAQQGTAGQSTQTCILVVDSPGAVGSQQYQLSIIQTGATAAGTPAGITLLALAL